MKFDFRQPIGNGGVLSSSPVAGCATNETSLAMKTITVSQILAWCVLAPLAVNAQPESRQPRGERPSFQAMWEKHDADGDGFLSIREFQSMPRIARLPEQQQLRLFNRLDKNEDGKVSQEELREIRQSRNGERPAHGMRRLMELDSDGSGGVSIEEFRAAELFANLPPERVEAMFRRLDTDGDGEISPKDRPEFPSAGRKPSGPRGERERGNRPMRPERGDRPEAHRRLFSRLDVDQSGSLDFEQFRKSPGIATMDEDAQEKLFLGLDGDNDKKLSIEEFSNAPLDEIAPTPRREGQKRRGARPSPEMNAPDESEN